MHRTFLGVSSEVLSNSAFMGAVFNLGDIWDFTEVFGWGDALAFTVTPNCVYPVILPGFVILFISTGEKLHIQLPLFKGSSASMRIYQLAYPVASRCAKILNRRNVRTGNGGT